jgi:RNA polymerase sigma factor (sigma-70 family)
MKPTPSTPTVEEQSTLATTLLANLGAFQSFARRRLGDEQLGAEAVQDSLLRALKNEHMLSHDANLLAWFYRILRNVLTDLHRRRAVQTAALEQYAQEQILASEGDADFERTACACFRGLLPALRPEYAEVLELADLQGHPTEVVAERIGISRSNLKVRLHRARRQMRERLEQTCRLCAQHHCLDCHCASNS